MGFDSTSNPGTANFVSVPEPSPLRPHKPKIEERICPQCRKDRPEDWFVAEDSRCWKCRSLGDRNG